MDERNRAYLVQIKRVFVQGIKGIRRRTLASPPFLHLSRTEIVRRINFSSPPLASLEFFHCPALRVHFVFFQEFRTARRSLALVCSGTYCTSAYGTTHNILSLFLQIIPFLSFDGRVQETRTLLLSLLLKERNGVLRSRRTPPKCCQWPNAGATERR